MAEVNSTSSSTQGQSVTDIYNPKNSNVTDKGTRIVKKGQDMDKNAFLKILAAELSNQDPDNAKDGTEYVSQMAQWTNLEQMTNLNSRMTLTGANSFIGKNVTFKDTDYQGNPINGLVTNVTKNGDDVELKVLVGQEKDSNGNLVDSYKEFNLDDVTAINDDINSLVNTAQNATNNFLNASALIGKTVEINEQDSNKNNYTGEVKGISKDSSGIKVKVQVGQNDVKEFPFDEVISVK